MTSEGSGLRLVDFLDHIAEAARLAREYVGGMSQESFLQDRRTQQAVVQYSIALPGTCRLP
jgi:uncharacterized protein with HEPN domain